MSPTNLGKKGQPGLQSPQNRKPIWLWLDKFRQFNEVLRSGSFKKLMLVSFVIGLLLIIVLGVMVPMPGGESGVLSTHDKFAHEVAYAGLAVVGLLAGFRPIWLSLGLVMHGATVELLQSLTLYRTGDWMDLLADASGVALVMLGRAIFWKFFVASDQ